MKKLSNAGVDHTELRSSGAHRVLSSSSSFRGTDSSRLVHNSLLRRTLLPYALLTTILLSLQGCSFGLQREARYAELGGTIKGQQNQGEGVTNQKVNWRVRQISKNPPVYQRLGSKPDLFFSLIESCQEHRTPVGKTPSQGIRQLFVGIQGVERIETHPEGVAVFKGELDNSKLLLGVKRIPTEESPTCTKDLTLWSFVDQFGRSSRESFSDALQGVEGFLEAELLLAPETTT